MRVRYSEFNFWNIRERKKEPEWETKMGHHDVIPSEGSWLLWNIVKKLFFAIEEQDI